MFKSFINPENIIGNGTNAVTPKSFFNFMSGKNSTLGSTSLNNVKNSTSNFSKTKVRVNTSSNISSLLPIISTNIINNVDNSISNTLNAFKTEIQSLIDGVQKQAQSNLSVVIQNFSKDYQQRIQTKEDSKPSNILKGFLGLYQNAINYATFFGDSKNTKKIEKNLKSLRVIFEDSFDAAITIRKVINKIVKQLSNLPTASGKSGALNLDVHVPGGPLKQAGRVSIGKFIRGGGGKLIGAGVVGAAGLGLMGMQVAKASQEEKLLATSKKSGEKDSDAESNKFMDGLNDIIDKFSSAIDSLLGGKKASPGGGEASSGGGGSTNNGGASESLSSSASLNAGASGPQGPATKSLLDAISFAEGTYDKPNRGYNTFFGGGQHQDLSKHPDIVKGSKGGYQSAAFGRYQFMPKTWSMLGGGAMSPERQDVGAIELIIKRLNNAGIRVKNGEELESLLQKEGGVSPRIAAALSPEWASFPTVSGGSYYGQPVRRLKEIQSFYNQRLKNQGVLGLAAQPPKAIQKPNPTVTPQAKAPPKIEPTAKAKPREISRNVLTPPGTQDNNIQVASLPPNVTVIPGESSKSGGNLVMPPPTGGDSNKPDVSKYGQSINPNNPYWAIPFSIGVLNA
jgi:lysozyme